MKQYKLTFSDEKIIDGTAYIGGKTFLPDNIEWPKNPKGENLVFIISIPTNYLNKYFDKKFIENKIISVFTTYNKKDYFLDLITYDGDDEELKNIRNGYTKVLIHDINNSARNESVIEIPKKTFELELFDEKEYAGSKISGEPYFLQKETLKLENYEYILQIYGNDFPEDYNDIFYLNDSIGYLFIKEQNGIFFTQCT
jgi:uncharacterized protein YwqG